MRHNIETMSREQVIEALERLKLLGRCEDGEALLALHNGSHPTNQIEMTFVPLICKGITYELSDVSGEKYRARLLPTSKSQKDRVKLAALLLNKRDDIVAVSVREEMPGS